MKYSMLAIHCTSFCFEVMLMEGFFSMNEDDVQSMYEDVYSLIYERLNSIPNTAVLIDCIVIAVTQKVLSILWRIIRYPDAMDSGQILQEIDCLIKMKIDSEIICNF